MRLITMLAAVCAVSGCSSFGTAGGGDAGPGDAGEAGGAGDAGPDAGPPRPPIPAQPLIQSTNERLSNVSSIGLPFPKDVTAGDLLVVATDYFAGNPQITDSLGNSFTIQRTGETSNGLFCAIASATTTTSGADTVTVDVGASNKTALNVYVHEFRGVTTLDASTLASGSGAIIGAQPVNVSMPPELVFGYIVIGSGNTKTVGPPFSIAENQYGNWTVYAVVDHAAPVPLTGTSDDSPWAVLLASFY